MSNIYVKLCPFCGSENISFKAFSISPDSYVLCNQCNASIEISVPWDDMDTKEHDKVCFKKLLTKWNKRASQSKQPELNENQQVVLDWLKEDYSKNRWTSPFGTIYGAIRQHESQIRILPQEQQAQVLQAFSRWALEEENNG